MRLLALIPEAGGVRACLDLAAAAGIDPIARVEVLHVRVDPLVAGRLDEEVALYRVRDHYEGSADERARATWAAFDGWVATAPPEIVARLTPRESAGREAEAVRHAGWCADLLVMARPRGLDGRDALHAAVFGSGKPLLLAPHHGAPPPARLERHMLIAWKPTDQARRAVAGALPWLRRADKVSVLTVTRHRQVPDPAELLDLLSSEGIEPEPVTGDAIDGRTSARILQAVVDLDVSCLVIGAYRHGPLVEWALGATTRRVLDEIAVPVLTAH